MKQNHLKQLLKHIISEVSSQTEMIANKDVEPDVFGAVNVEESKDKKKRICFHCKQPRPCKCDKYDNDMSRRIEKGDPAFKMKVDKKNDMEEGFFDNNIKKKAQSLFGKIKKITKTSHPSSNSEYFTISFEIPGRNKIIRKDKDGKLFLAKHEGNKLKFEPLVFKNNEQSSSGAAGAYSTPFAFAPTHHKKKKKKKHVKEGNFLNKIKTEKILPDGRYANDMEDPARSNKVSGLTEDDENKKEKLKMLLKKRQELSKRFKNASGEGDSRNTHLAQRELDYEIEKLKQNMDEQTSSGAAGGQPGGTIQVPAWGTKNKLGSPRGIAGSAKLGYKVVKSITNEEQ